MDYKTLLFSFEGRINRKPYWMFFLCAILLNIAAVALSMVLGKTMGMIFVAAYSIALVWFGLAVSVKRWHDRDKSGWWVLISLVPLIGTIWVLIENGFLKGTEGQNRFGPDPLAGGS
jgi:uncharacterized membrane protein YhaH (DUF805 family)